MKSGSPQISDALAQARASFAAWRNGHSSRRPWCPPQLKSLAVSLTRDHPIRQVAEVLDLNRNTLKSWMGDESLSITSPEEIEFVEVSTSAEATGTIDVILPSGIIIRSSANVPATIIGRYCSELRKVR